MSSAVQPEFSDFRQMAGFEEFDEEGDGAGRLASAGLEGGNLALGETQARSELGLIPAVARTDGFQSFGPVAGRFARRLFLLRRHSHFVHTSTA